MDFLLAELHRYTAAVGDRMEPVGATCASVGPSSRQARCYHGTWELKGTVIADENAPSVGV
jgi:hypothetical protein